MVINVSILYDEAWPIFSLVTPGMHKKRGTGLPDKAEGEKQKKRNNDQQSIIYWDRDLKSQVVTVLSPMNIDLQNEMRKGKKRKYPP